MSGECLHLGIVCVSRLFDFDCFGVDSLCTLLFSSCFGFFDLPSRFDCLYLDFF